MNRKKAGSDGMRAESWGALKRRQQGVQAAAERDANFVPRICR